jgi:hypothetical protein
MNGLHHKDKLAQHKGLPYSCLIASKRPFFRSLNMNATAVTLVNTNAAPAAGVIAISIAKAVKAAASWIAEAAEAYAARAAARRADARFLAAAYSDPRIMAELDAARCRAEENNFDNALAPFGMDAPAVAKKRPFKVRLSAPMAAITNNSGRRTPLYYI